MKEQNTQKVLCSLRKDGKKICIITGTRAEWGLLSPLAKTIFQDNFFDLHIIATGTHLSPLFGNTLEEIQQDTQAPIHTIPILTNQMHTHSDIAQTIANTIVAFTDFFIKNPCDIVIVLGDRYEIFASCIAVSHLNIPIIHLCGGETTQGANDEYMRHCITKMSYLHFPTTETYKQRILQLGEHPSRVFNYGSLAYENLCNTPLLSQQQLSLSIGVTPSFLDYFCLLTFHPTTLQNNNSKEEIFIILESILQTNLMILVTKANADFGGYQINIILKQYAEKNPDRIHLVSSLGKQRYFSALKLAKFIIGNSSSGLSEAPMLKTPTINIGDRQKGRFAPKGVYHIPCCHDSIITTIQYILNNPLSQWKEENLPFGNGNTSKLITATIKDFITNKKINLQKSFYDLSIKKDLIFVNTNQDKRMD